MSNYTFNDPLCWHRRHHPEHKIPRHQGGPLHHQMLNHQLTERSRLMRLAPLCTTWKESQSASMFWRCQTFLIWSEEPVSQWGNVEEYCRSRCTPLGLLTMSCAFSSRRWSTWPGKVVHLWCTLRCALQYSWILQCTWKQCVPSRCQATICHQSFL